MSTLTTITFDYTTIDPALAAEARATADRIQGRLRASYFDTGRDLIAMKQKMPHGAFGSWVKAEFGMTDRTAENYMNAARLLEGKSETVSILAPSVVYALAAPGAPAAFVNEVIAEAEAGNAPPAREIKARLAEARDAERKANIEAAKTPEQIKKEREAEKRRKASEVERMRRVTEDREADDLTRAAKARRVAQFIVATVGARGVVDLLVLLHGTDWYRVEKHFKKGPGFTMNAAEIDAAFGDSIDTADA